MTVVLIGASGEVSRAFRRRVLAERGASELRVVRHTAEPTVERVVERVVEPATRSLAAVTETSGQSATDSSAVVTVDLQDPNALARAFEHAHVVVHAAALAEAGARDGDLERVHVLGTENIVRAAQHVGCKRLVLLSTADVSLVPEDRINWNEARTLTRRPLGAYAQSRLLAEEISLAHSRPGFEVVALRPAVVWGGSVRSTLQAFHPDAVERGIAVHGKGDNWFCTTHLEHVVDAMMLALRLDNREVQGQAYYISDGEVLTSGEFASAISEALRLPKPRRRFLGPTSYPPFARRVFSSWFDTLKAHAQLGFRPRISAAEGMRQLAAARLEDVGASRSTTRE